MIQNEKTPDFRRGLECQRSGLDSWSGSGVTLNLRKLKMEDTITHRYRPCTTPFHLVIRRSPLCVGAFACLIWGAGCAVQSKPTPQLSSKGVTGAGHLAGWNDAEHG